MDTISDVMIVDDDATFLEYASDLLKKEDITHSKATSGEECLEKLKSENPDLVLLDLMMPEMNGWETYEKIKERDIDTEVVLISVLKDKPDIDSTEVTDYLVKERQIKKENFVEPIKKILGES